MVYNMVYCFRKEIVSYINYNSILLGTEFHNEVKHERINYCIYNTGGLSNKANLWEYFFSLVN